MTGALNGGTKPFSAAVLAEKQVLWFCLITTSPSKFRELIAIPRDEQLTLVNLYAPNDDDPNFFTSVFEHLADFQCDEVIIGGDYNLVLDVEKDKKRWPCKNTQKSLEVLNKFSDFWGLRFGWCLESSKSWITTLYIEAKESRDTLQTWLLSRT